MPPGRAACSPEFPHPFSPHSKPAPQLLDGLWQVHNHVEGGHTAYLLRRHSFHGWWYFFPVALAVKTPLAILLLAALGVFAPVAQALGPAVSRFVSTRVKSVPMSGDAAGMSADRKSVV